MAQEDRFANVFTAMVRTSAANILTFAEMNFGITFRDRTAIVIDELYFYPADSSLAELTTTADALQYAITVSDNVTDLTDLADRRIIYAERFTRFDFGVAASGTLYRFPWKQSFFPPMILLPTRVFFGVDSIGLASAHDFWLRMHFRTVKITDDRALAELLETMALST